MQVPAELTDYNVQSVTEGIDALANTRVSIKPVGSRGMTVSAQGREFKRTFTGMGADEDIVVSSARSYVSALNKMIAFLRSEEQRAQSRVRAAAGWRRRWHHGMLVSGTHARERRLAVWLRMPRSLVTSPRWGQRAKGRATLTDCDGGVAWRCHRVDQRPDGALLFLHSGADAAVFSRRADEAK